MKARVRRVEAADVPDLLPGLAALLADAVNAGASLGFWAPLRPSRSLAYWHDVRGEVEAGAVLLLVAEDDEGIAGSVQLELCGKDNGAHRVEVRKLMVLSAHRRAGVGRALMQAAEAEARSRQRTLLVLDTRTGDGSEAFYRALGYRSAGSIPGFVREADGSSSDTTYYYRHLA
jgi:acetyltransferase